MRAPLSKTHSCFAHRERRPLNEGDDCIVERCWTCGRVRHEQDGVRPMAWFLDASNPTGFRYAYDDPHNKQTNAFSIWKDPDGRLRTVRDR